MVIAAYIRGCALSVWSVIEGIAVGVMHPRVTVAAARDALARRDDLADRLESFLDTSREAALHDPARFAETTGFVVGGILATIAVAGALQVVARRAGRWMIVWWYGDTPVRRRLRRTFRLPPGPRAVFRARDRRLHRRTARRGRGVARWVRRLRDLAADLGRGTVQLFSRPWVPLLIVGRAAGGLALRTAAASARFVGTAVQFAAVPVLLVFLTEIGDAVARETALAESRPRVRRAVAKLLAEAEESPPGELARALDELQGHYRVHRGGVLVGLRRNEARLDACFAALDRVARELPPQILDVRVKRCLEAYSRRTAVRRTEAWLGHLEQPHDMAHPSPSRLLSYVDELAALRAVEARAGAAAAAELEHRIFETGAALIWETCLFWWNPSDVAEQIEEAEGDPPGLDLAREAAREVAPEALLDSFLRGPAAPFDSEVPFELVVEVCEYVTSSYIEAFRKEHGIDLYEPEPSGSP